jgi:hypothetical protein
MSNWHGRSFNTHPRLPNPRRILQAQVVAERLTAKLRPGEMCSILHQHTRFCPSAESFTLELAPSSRYDSLFALYFYYDLIPIFASLFDPLLFTIDFDLI